MSKKNTVVKVRYIPAGMKISSHTEWLSSDAKKQNSNKPKPEETRKSGGFCDQKESGQSVTLKNTHSPTEKHHSVEVTVQRSMVPPKTICKNKSLNVDDYSFEINKNVMFHVDRENPNVVDNVVSSEHLSGEDCIKSSDNEAKSSFKNKIIGRLKKQAKAEPEIKENDLNLKPYEENGKQCQCVKCDNFLNCPVWCNDNIKFPESPPSKKGLPLIKSSVFEKPTTIIKKFDKIILHGPILPKPVFSLDKTFIQEDIQSALKTMNCGSAKDIQSYMWPAIQRGLNVFMVGPPKSGKTLAYLPALCTFAMEENERFLEASESVEPVIVILCFDIQKCNELQSLAKTLLADCFNEPKVEVLADDSSIQSNCDMLITVPPILEACVKKGTVKLKRLCHFAIEEAHLVLKNHNQSMGNLIKVISELQINRPRNKNIQVVLSSEKWSADLETLLKKMYVTPIVCFEDFIEAAVYSKIQFKKKKLKTSHKLFYLDDVLKKNYMTCKTVIFCHESNIQNINEHLLISGIECIVISDNLIEDEIFENEDMWNSLHKGHYKVLLCTDALFEKTVRILNAEWLVHFCVPTHWTQFQKRFRCLSSNFCSPLEECEEFSSKCSFLIIDELGNNQVFLDFFEVLTRNLVALRL